MLHGQDFPKLYKTKQNKTQENKASICNTGTSLWTILVDWSCLVLP